MRKIELPTEEQAEELQRYLQSKRFGGATYDRAEKTIQYPDSMHPAEWAAARATVEKWARGRNMEVSESLRLSLRPVQPQGVPESREREAELKKRLDALTPERAEERYNYLRTKSISELTDAEYEERLALAQSLSAKGKPTKESKS